MKEKKENRRYAAALVTQPNLPLLSTGRADAKPCAGSPSYFRFLFFFFLGLALSPDLPELARLVALDRPS